MTRYVYGSHVGVTSPEISRNDLPRAEIYPDSDDTRDLGDGADGVFDRVEYKYNRQGQLIEKKDQNGTVHVYQYDPLGRQIRDRVTELGDGVDDAVLRIETTFEIRGLPEKITSHDNATVGSGNVVNDVKMVYNTFGSLISGYQGHSAVVDDATSPKVVYGYADGSAGHVRPTRVTYPNGRVLRHEYNFGADDAFNRASFLADDEGGQIGWRLAEYSYLGLGQVVEMHHEEPDLMLSLAHGLGNDPYDGLARFGRTVDMRWTCCPGDSSSQRQRTEQLALERRHEGPQGLDRRGRRPRADADSLAGTH